MHIKGIQNTVADAISRLNFGLVQDEKANWMLFTKCWCHYTMHAPPEESSSNQQHQMNMVFANHCEEDVIYRLTVKESALAQGDESVVKKLSKTERYSTQLVEIHKSYARMARWPPPKFFRVEQFVGNTTTCSILDMHVLKRCYMNQCIGKVCKTPYDHMSKTVVHVKSTNNTSTRK